VPESFYYSVSRKETKMFFFVIFSIKLALFLWNLICRFLNKFASDVNVSHPTCVMSLHYLVELEMLIGQVLPLSCYRKKLLNLSHLDCGLQIRQIWIQLITVLADNINLCINYATSNMDDIIWKNKKLISRWDSEREVLTTTFYT